MLDWLKESESEIIQHGACLGLGLMSIGTFDSDLLIALKETLFKDKAISGEAAAIAIGLLYMGKIDNDLIDELINFAKDNKHEKIIRAIGISISLMLNATEN